MITASSRQIGWILLYGSHILTRILGDIKLFLILYSFIIYGSCQLISYHPHHGTVKWEPGETFKVFTEQEFFSIYYKNGNSVVDQDVYNSYDYYSRESEGVEVEIDRINSSVWRGSRSRGRSGRRKREVVDYPFSSYVKSCVHSVDMWPDKVVKIISPFHGQSQYPAGVECEWELIGTEECIPQVTCDTIDLRSSENCEQDILLVSDGSTSEKMFCGNNQGFSTPFIARNGFYLYLNLKTGDSTHFDRLYKGFDCTAMCHIGTLTRKDPQPLPLGDFIREEFTCLCGRQLNERSRIVGGTSAEKKEFPWLVALVKAGTRQPFCGGSLINDQFILTAAHCLAKTETTTSVEILLHAHILEQTKSSDMKQADVELGKNGSTRSAGYKLEVPTDAQEKTLRLPVDRIMIHRMYDLYADSDNDVALLRLKTPLNLKDRDTDDSVTPICLPQPDAFSVDLKGKTALVSGWGYAHEMAGASTKILQKLEIPIIAKPACDEFYKEFGLSNNMMCAGSSEGGKDACQGDSGGPLLVKEGDAFVQVGIVSWGEGCGRKTRPGIYTKVANFISWIRHKARQGTWCRRT